MTRAVRPGSIQAVVRASYRAVGGIECAADDLALSATTLSYGTEVSEVRPGGLGINYLDRLARFDKAAALPVAQHFALLAGGIFQPLNLTGITAPDIHHITREFADVLSKHSEAHSASSENPDDYTPKEALDQIKELDELIEVSATLRAALMQKAGV